MVAWLGGLLPLAFAIQRGSRRDARIRRLPLALLIPRFSRLTMRLRGASSR